MAEVLVQVGQNRTVFEIR